MVVSQPAEDHLNERQAIDYREHRKSLIKWALNVGKKPEKGEGYAQTTIENRAYLLDQFYRWIWSERNGGYTTEITTDDADAYMEKVAFSNFSSSSKSNAQKSLKMLFKWQRNSLGREVDLEPEMSFSSSSQLPQDYFTREERQKIREAALEYGTIPAYNGLSSKERDKWRAHLAQRFEKPKSKVGPEDWKRANGMKIPSLVWTSLDAGLRPIEVKRSITPWIDIENGVIRIPKEQSSKNSENWVVSLRSRTTEMLERWTSERENYEKYGDSNSIWLTREGNPYASHSLNHVFRRLCGIANISTENCSISWYSIRHSVGTYMTREEDLAAAAAQLRHRSIQTTMKYDQTPIEDRRDALDRMG